ncbi:MAG: hypothetical protein H7306_21975 [Bacteriovorax sp.]|nr:hypothetical protein [Rhizobacter sp.]
MQVVSIALDGNAIAEPSKSRRGPVDPACPASALCTELSPFRVVQHSYGALQQKTSIAVKVVLHPMTSVADTVAMRPPSGPGESP